MPGPNDCQECGQLVEDAGAFHPYLYCELYKLGHHDQEAWLRAYGFERVPVSTQEPGREDT